MSSAREWWVRGADAWPSAGSSVEHFVWVPVVFTVALKKDYFHLAVDLSGTYLPWSFFPPFSLCLPLSSEPSPQPHRVVMSVVLLFWSPQGLLARSRCIFTIATRVLKVRGTGAA